ncbi:hypothetical protein [Ralstonia psammae]|nr:hypothetical protein [Ralstonia sp. LMG 19083]
MAVTRTGRLLTLYGKDTHTDLQRLENQVFRLSERANALDKYLAAQGQ